MPGYWPSTFFLFYFFFIIIFFYWVFMFGDGVNGQKHEKKGTRPMSSNLDRTSLVNDKGFNTWDQEHKKMNFARGTNA